MEVKICKTCGKQFLSETDNSYCRICNKKWYEKQRKIREQAENLKWQEQKEQERKLFEAKVQTYKPILMESVNPSAHTLYIIGNGFDLMHRVPSSYYNFRDSLGKNNSLRYSLETALTAEDIWADFENALGTLNLNLMGNRNIIDDIIFVYNNRVRKYDLNTGELIANQQMRDAKSKEYSGKDVMNKFVGRGIWVG